MRLEIVFTPKAKETFLYTTLQIKEKWGLKSANNFVARSHEVFKTISLQPFIFKTYSDMNIRKGLITKQTSFLYRVLDDKIEILVIWDNRQEPAFK